MKIPVRKIISVTLALLMIFSLSSCNVFDVFSVDSLIRAPKLTGTYASIQNAFETAVGTDIALVNPLTGDYRSAYVLNDFDNDKDYDSIVFYKPNSSPDEVHMHVLECIDNEWISIGDITGNGSEVYKIEFYNLDSDSESEFAVSWCLSDSKRTKTLALYEVYGDTTDNLLHSLAVVQMTDYMCLDIDSDGVNEIFYTYSTISKNTNIFNAALFEIDADSMEAVPVSDIAISKNIEQVLEFNSDIKDAIYSIYIDCLATDGRYFTEIIEFDYTNNALVRPVDKNGKYISDYTYRVDMLLSSDVNEDYMIEIPVQFEYEESVYQDTNSQQSGKIYYTSYMQYQDGKLQSVSEVYINSYNEYSLQIDEFRQKTYLVFVAETGSLQIKLKDCKEKDDLLFIISCNSGHSSENEIYVSVSSLGNSLGFTEESVKKLIQQF